MIREEEIKEELEIAIRCFVDAFITSKKEGADQFDKMSGIFHPVSDWWLKANLALYHGKFLSVENL